MNPIDNSLFSDDYQRFVLQTPHVNEHSYQATPKPFDLGLEKKASKTKKDLKKQKDSDSDKKKHK